MTAPRIAWEQLTLDPRRAENAGMRASDRDRDVALGVVSEAYADGRLDRAELEERSTQVQSAKRLGELLAPLGDLAADEPERRPSREPASGASHPGPPWLFLGPALVCWAVWLATCLGPHGLEPSFPWPLFVTLGTARLAFGRHPWHHGRRRLG